MKLIENVVSLGKPRWINTLNSLEPYKPDSLWQAIRNKQRVAYAQGLAHALEIYDKLENKDEFPEAIIEQHIRTDEQWE